MLKLIIFIFLLGFSILLFLLSFFKKLVFRPFYFILLAAAAASAFGVVKDIRGGDTVLRPQKSCAGAGTLYFREASGGGPAEGFSPGVRTGRRVRTGRQGGHFPSGAGTEQDRRFQTERRAPWRRRCLRGGAAAGAE